MATFTRFQRVDSGRNRKSGNPFSRYDSYDWETEFLKCEAMVRRVGLWLLSDDQTTRILRKAALGYDNAQFLSIVEPLLLGVAEALRNARLEDDGLDGSFGDYLSNNYEYMSRWLYSQLNDKEHHAERASKLQSENGRTWCICL
jgi:hypothetical protein